MNLEHESAELRLFGVNHALFGGFRLRVRSNFRKAIEQFAHPKVVEGGTEKHRLKLTTQVGVVIKFGIDSGDELEFFAQGFGGLGANALHEFGIF